MVHSIGLCFQIYTKGTEHALFQLFFIYEKVYDLSIMWDPDQDGPFVLAEISGMSSS